MSKYIAKQKAISALINEANTHNNPVKRAYTRAAAIIEQITAEDVQPVNRWISVKDRLPNDGERVLIYVPKTQNKYYVAAFYTLRDEIKFAMNIYGMSYCWYAEDVAYWQPLPELPKDGEKE
jgi:hypothetical protein